MTKKKQPEPIDPKQALPEVFGQLGGVAEFAKWARTHKSAFYNHYCKLTNQPLVQTNVQVNVRESVEENRAAFIHLLDSLIEARRAARGAIDVTPNSAPPSIVDVDTRRGAEDAPPLSIVGDDEAPRRGADDAPQQTTDARPPTTDAQSEMNLKNSKSATKRVPLAPAGRSTQSERAEPAERSTTQKFYDYYNNGGGSGLMTGSDWSPPPGWPRLP